MILFLSIVIFLLGLIVGSFLNVVVIRSHRKESLGGRSKCMSCRKNLAWKELIPLLSYLFQKGRCRSCGAAFSVQYPLLELATALSFVSVFVLFINPKIYLADWPELLALSLALFTGVGAALVIAVSDLRYQTIPNTPTVLLMILGTISVVFRVRAGMPLLPDVISALVLGLLLASLCIVSRGKWMGLGDAKLIIPTSLIVGYPHSVTAFLFSFWLGGIIGVLLLLFQLKKLQSRIPFGPFILAGSVLAFFLGPNIVFLNFL